MNAKIILVTPMQVVKILMAVLHVLVILDSSVMVSLVKMLMNAKAITIVMTMPYASIIWVHLNILVKTDSLATGEIVLMSMSVQSAMLVIQPPPHVSNEYMPLFYFDSAIFLFFQNETH